MKKSIITNNITISDDVVQIFGGSVVDNNELRTLVGRLTKELKLDSSFSCFSQGTFFEIRGSRETLLEFLLCLEEEKTSQAAIQKIELLTDNAINKPYFQIFQSRDTSKDLVLNS